MDRNIEKKISCFLAGGDKTDLTLTVSELKVSQVTGPVYVPDNFMEIVNKPSSVLSLSGFTSFLDTRSLKSISGIVTTPYLLFYTKSLPLKPGPWALERLLQVAEDTGAGMVYSDYYAMKEGKLQSNPVIDYQRGSLRDDFNFGSLLLFRTDAYKEAVSRMDHDFRFAALYDLRLKVSQNYNICRLPEFLYTEVETDTRLSGEKQFDYVDPKNRQVQLEMEKACTLHLQAIGGWLKPEFQSVAFAEGQFSDEASVIIPVRNRARTIEDAVRSVFSQVADFPFNLIVVDNHSTDGTTEILCNLAAEDKRLVHLIPDRNDLGIGGCWTAAIMDARCGRFAVQLDSDDLYINDRVLQTIVDCFKGEKCAMVIGSYRMVNFKLEEIPPGIIDHKEWTPDNGANNALRINGLGAPRAFYTPLLREIRIPNTSYGEDYAVGIRLSRQYKIGRIYEPLYLCRRWDENSDSALDVVKTNNHNLYKDRLRTVELLARIALNSGSDKPL
jgi:hypothetical protein